MVRFFLGLFKFSNVAESFHEAIQDGLCPMAAAPFTQIIVIKIIHLYG